jgi:rubrerythrin
MPRAIATVEEFYAHALAIEREAGERYAEFAEWFDGRGEDVLAGLCHNLAGFEREHYQQLVRGCELLAIPAIDPGAYRWLAEAAPETGARELFFRAAKPRHVLEIALEAELRARDFFVHVARTSPSQPVRELASIMAAEEAQHVGWVTQAIEYLPREASVPA